MKVLNELGADRYQFLFARLLMIGAILLVLLSMILSTYVFMTSAKTTSQATQGNPTAAARKPTPTPTNDTEVASQGQQYMNALLQQHYDVMWSMLNPQVQATWSDEQTFASYWTTRFHDYTLQSFTVGKVSQLASWVNPETMTRYSQVEEAPISLQLKPKVAADQIANLPLPDQNPSQLFQNLPFIVQQISHQTGKGGAHQWQILSGGPADLEAPILPPATPALKTAQVPILMYHHITDVKPMNVLDWSLTVTPTVFGQQLDYLKAHGYQTITFNQLFAALYYNGPLPAKPIILTFDDGYDDGYKFAYPILQSHGYSGMFYIVTGKVNWQGQMTWNQLREMLANGMQMGSHTIHHVDMGSVYLNSQAQALQEVQISRQDMEKQLGIPIQQFCYPSGAPFKTGSLALRQSIMDLLAQNGYVGATTDPGATGIIQSSQTPLALLRIRVDGRESLQAFTLGVPA